MRLSDSVALLPGVGEQRLRLLRAAGIDTIHDLLNRYPRDYDDRTQLKTVSMLFAGEVSTVRGFIASEGETVYLKRKPGMKPLLMTKRVLRDETGELQLIWFNRPYLKKYFDKTREYVFTGKVVYSYGRLQMESPDYEKIEPDAPDAGRIVPLYTSVKNIPQKLFRTLIKAALEHTWDDFTDDLPSPVREEYKLYGKYDAVRQIHLPQNNESFLAARRRLVFEELFFMQSALLSFKGTAEKARGLKFNNTDCAPFLNTLPFSLTSAQASVLRTISEDMRSGTRMNRLIQGDVGSGKTAVAMAAAFLAIVNGFQSALMAPTEVLAAQHFANFNKYFAPLNIKTVLLTGGQPLRERGEALKSIAGGEAGMLIGTHALIQQAVEYRSLGLVITDEQHRFGVNQRFLLSKKAENPHVLVMTATPIPRTLALILYGDMDISVINEMPPGRQTIRTYCVNSSFRERIDGFMRRETDAGRQVYVICPSIEGTDGETTPVKADIENVTRYAKRLSEALPGVNIAALHGRMKPGDKQAAMDGFAANEIQILVATTVVEVGVDVPNANLMVIENAERFGLSQLHQLRGRVGRGTAQSYCVLITDDRSERAAARMKAMTQTADGFELSELDLKQRGAGDFFGVRQHGLPSFTISNLYRDADILAEAQAAAIGVFKGLTPLPPECAERYTRRVNEIRMYNGGAVPL